MISRRGLLAGLASLMAAPAIVRAESLPVGRVSDMQPLFWQIKGICTEGWVCCTLLPVGDYQAEPINRALLEYKEVYSVTHITADLETETENLLTEPMYPQKSWMRDYYDRKDQDDSRAS